MGKIRVGSFFEQIDGVFQAARFRLALETIHDRTNGVRLIGLVVEFEFHWINMLK